MKKLLIISTLCFGCGAAPYDLEADTSSIEAGPVLAFLNGPTVTLDQLDGDVGLDSRAAKSIADRVLGRDGVFGTGDERPLASIEELDALPYIGESALRLIADYVRAHRVASTVSIEGVQITLAQAEAILRVANTATFEALDVDARLDARAARAIVAARPIADLAALAAVAYVSRPAVEKLLAYADIAPANPTIVSFTVRSARGTEIAIDWNVENAAECQVVVTTTFNRRRTNVLDRSGLPARSSLGIAWLTTWGDTVDVVLSCRTDLLGVGANDSVTRTPPVSPSTGAIDCTTLRGGAFDSVRFTAAQECTAVHLLDEARFSDMTSMTEIGRRTAYDCTPDGRCARNEWRRSRWTSLAQYSGFAGIGQTTMQGLITAIASWSAGGASNDTVADLWARKSALVDAPVNLDRVYVAARTRNQGSSTFPYFCVEVRDAVGAPNYLTACIRYVNADSAAGCTGAPASCLDPVVGSWVSLRGSIAAAREAPGGYRINLVAEGPVPAAGNPPPAPARPFAVSTGTFVDLEGIRAEVLRVDADVLTRAAASPSEYPVFVAAYRVDPVSLGDQAIGAAFASALDVQDSLTSDNVAVGNVVLANLGRALADRLDLHSPSTSAAARPGLIELGAIMARSATQGYSANQEDSGDYSYVSVVAVDSATGEIRILGFRRDP